MNNPLIFHSLKEVQDAKIKYILSIGKRQPMHIGHKKSLERILAINNIRLIYVIGSVNTVKDPLFDPFTNPLNLSQQIEQFKIAFPENEAIFLPILDVKDMSEWGPSIISSLAELNIKPQDCAIHFIGKPEDRLKTANSFYLPNGEEIILEPRRWLIEAIGYYDIAIWFDDEIEVDLNISARNLREIDLESEQKSAFATPDYLLKIAKEARDQLSSGPITLRDLSLKRIKSETL
jgi:hypothetical protein